MQSSGLSNAARRIKYEVNDKHHDRHDERETKSFATDRVGRADCSWLIDVPSCRDYRTEGALDRYLQFVLQSS